MAIQITEEDLTEKDLTRIRIQHKIYLSNTKNPSLNYQEYIQHEIDQFNDGKLSVIERDIFEEVMEPVILKSLIQEQPIQPKVIERVSNVGKKLIVEYDNDQVIKYTLVANSDEIDPDNHKISIHSHMGEKIQYAKQGEIIDTEFGLIRIVEIQNAI